MPFAKFAKANAGRDGHIGALHQHLGKLHRPHRLVFFRDFSPGEHGRIRHRDVPASHGERLNQHIAAPFIGGADFLDTVPRPVQRGDRGDLNRGEGAVIKIGFHSGERIDEPLIAHRHADAPASHGEGFGKRIDLDGDILRPLDFQNGRRGLIAEIDLAIGEIGKDDDVVLSRQRHRILVEINAYRLRRGV